MTEIATSRRSGWTADDSTFGARLALIRQRMAWGNVKEAAIACGLPAESWRRWERDGRSPRNIVEVAAIIADRTGCEYGWLLAGPALDRRREQQQPTNAHSAGRTDRPRPFGHPKRTSPKASTVRPALVSSALAHA